MRPGEVPGRDTGDRTDTQQVTEQVLQGQGTSESMVRAERLHDGRVIFTARTEPDAPFRNGSEPVDLTVDLARVLWLRSLDAGRVDMRHPDDGGPFAGCWLWTGATSPDGYGHVNVRRADGRWTKAYAHRVAYVATTGKPIPPGMVVDHLCGNPSCVSAACLAVVTSRANIVRGQGVSARNAAKSSCPAGHALDGDNLSPSGLRVGHRNCRRCHLARVRAYAALSAAAADRLHVGVSALRASHDQRLATLVALVGSETAAADVLWRGLSTSDLGVLAQLTGNAADLARLAISRAVGAVAA